MSNWCSNYVVFKGDVEKIKKVEAFCQGMNFNKIVPMPESLDIDRSTFSQIAGKIFAGEELDEYEKYHYRSAYASFEDLLNVQEKGGDV